MKLIADREDDSQPQIDAIANKRKPSASEGYTPPTNLYAFPPNIDAVYPPPGDIRKPISIPNYLPPPSGPTNYPIYPGPVIPKPYPPLNSQVDNMQDTDENAGPNVNDGNGNGNGNTNMDNDGPDRPSDDMQIFDKPPPEFLSGKRPEVPSLPFLDHDHNHDHDDHHFDDSLKHLHGFEAFPGTLV